MNLIGVVIQYNPNFPNGYTTPTFADMCVGKYSFAGPNKVSYMFPNMVPNKSNHYLKCFVIIIQSNQSY